MYLLRIGYSWLKKKNCKNSLRLNKVCVFVENLLFEHDNSIVFYFIFCLTPANF